MSRYSRRTHQAPWFAGGTITVASVQGDRYYLAEGAAGFEDGTVDFLGLPAVRIGLDHLAKVGVGLIHERVEALAGWLLEAKANARGISPLRTGCFCNPGAGEIALGISRDELATCFTSPAHANRLTVDDFRDCIDGKSAGAVRISLGIASDFKDVRAFLEFAQGFLDK